MIILLNVIFLGVTWSVKIKLIRFIVGVMFLLNFVCEIVEKLKQSFVFPIQEIGND